MPNSINVNLFLQLVTPRFGSNDSYHAFLKDTNILSEIDCLAIFEVARENGVLGFLYRNTLDTDSSALSFKTCLRDCYQQITFANLKLLSESLNVITILSGNGIRVVPLKGVVASETIFQDLGVYPSGDIDILVRPEDISKAKNVLVEHGEYSEVDHIEEEVLLESHYHLMLSNGQHLLEIHWNLAKRYFEIPAEFWWRDIRTRTWRGIEILELSPEDYILYAIFRVFDHCFFPLRFWLLIAGIVETNAGLINWDLLLSNAQKYRMRRLVVFTLKLTNELFGTVIPDEVQQKRILGYGILKKTIYNGFFSGIKRKHLRMLIYTSLLDSPFDFFRVLFKRLFPTKSELCLRYKLNYGSPKIIIYYFLNPFLMFMKTSGK